MDVLITGSSGREHALVWKVAQDPHMAKIFVAPGNAGTVTEAKCENVTVDVLVLEQLVDFTAKNAQLATVGPEAPLVAGMVDLFRERGLDIFGPTASAAQLEGSEVFTKGFLVRHRIPTAAYRNFTEIEPVLAYLREQGVPTVIKADGLAAGKGMIIAMNLNEAEVAVRDMLVSNVFGDAGSRVVTEELLDGEEASFIVMADGQNVLPTATSQDHKHVGDGDSGSDIGGMGAYSPAPVVTAEVRQRVLDEVIHPIACGMAEEGDVYTGSLYAGLMTDKSGTPKVIEFSYRSGDPEAQSIMIRPEPSLVPLVEAVLAKALDKVEATWDLRPAVGMVLVADGHPSNYAKGEVIEGLTEVAALDGKVSHAGTVLKDGQVVTSGGRVLCATAIGESVSAAQQQAHRLAEKTRWNGCFYRGDIGYHAIARKRGEP